MKAPQLLAEAFHDDPYLSWAEPCPERRPRTLERVFTAMLAHSSRTGGTIYEPEVASVEWRSGERAHMSWVNILTSGLWRLAIETPLEVCRHFVQHEDAAMTRVQRFLGRETAYLCSLGVEPSQKGKGSGSRILQRALAMQQKHWRHCVLRTEQPRTASSCSMNS
jgi:GNAT superfamily N-acetyltransferase